MADFIHVEREAVRAIAAATFPNYTGSKFKIKATEAARLRDLNWSGGSRSQYRACTLDGRALGAADKYNAVAPWENGAEGASVSIPPGTALVEHSMFCGKDMGLTVYVNPANMPAFLPATGDDLTADQKTVLAIVRCLISRARRDEAARKGINAARYDEIIGELKSTGYLSPSGGLTVKGKNSAGRI